MTAASNSDARKRNAAQVDPVEVVARAIAEACGLPWDDLDPLDQTDGRAVSARVVAALRAEGMLP